MINISLFSQFEYFDDDVFHSLRRLIILRLDGNRLSVISAALLPVQKSLEQLGRCAPVQRAFVFHFPLFILATHKLSHTRMCVCLFDL